MRRPILLAGVLLLIAAVLFILFQQDAPKTDPGAAERVASNGASAGSAQPAPVPVEAPSNTQEPGIGRSEARVDPAPGSAAAAQNYKGPWLHIEVVRGEPALPAANARVTVMTPDPDRQQELMMLFLTGISVPELLQSQGVTHDADQAGKVSVPMPLEHGLIAAELADGFTLAEWDPTSDATGQDRNLKLTLAPSRSVDILVVNAAGQPLAGAPVCIRFGDENFQMDFLRDRTEADGVARMEHVLKFLESFTPGMNLPCSVALTAPLLQPVAAPLDLANPPDEPIRLLMPDFGRLEVEARHADGSLVEDDQIVFLAKPRERPEDDDDFFIPGLPGFESIAERTLNGVAVFAYVGLGMDLEATAAFADAPESTHVRGRGPERAGETVRLVLKESLEFPVLTGRLLAMDGQPLAARIAELRIPDEENFYGMNRSRKLTTGADGSFRLAMRSTEMIPLPQRAEFMIVGKAADGALLVSFEIPPLRAGENSVGDLRAGPAPVLAAGTVVGADGKPTAGATLCKMSWMQWDEDDPSNGQWMEDDGDEIACEEDGSFVLYGVPPEEGLRLLADAPGHLRKELEASPGALGLVIRLESGGTLRGKLLADPGIPLDDLVIQLLVPGVGMEEEGRHWASLDPADGSFTIVGLRPGIGVLTVSSGWAMEENDTIARIEGLAVGPDAAPDPRLDPIDLRGRLHGCRVRVRAEDGATISEFKVWREEAPDAQFHGWHGEVSVMSPQPLSRLVVSADGYRRQTVDAQTPDIEVKLRKGLEVLLQIPSAAAQFDGIITGVQLFRNEEGMSWGEEPRGFFEADGSLRLHLQDPGDFSVIFLAVRGKAPAPDDWGFTWIQTDAGLEYQSFAVHDVAGAQIVPLTPPTAAAVLAALAADEEER